MNRLTRPIACTAILFLMLSFTASPAWAVHEKADGFPWNVKLHGWHDRAIAEKLGTGWFMNVGPTGLRARITHEHPAYFTIKFVFDKSPAAGKITAGDIVIGANGKIMTTPHRFSRRSPTWQGPMTGMAKLIEESQSKDGKLNLIVWPGGDKAKQKTVTLQLKPVGQFSPTYPFNCSRSDKLIKSLCDFLAREYKRDGKFLSRTHTHSTCVLALMASGDRRYAPIIKKCVSAYVSKRYSPDNGGGFPVWGWGYDGIVMGEYYLLTKDRSLIPAAASLAKAFELGQDYRSGGYSHKPFPFIQKRIASGGAKGYGAMSQPGGLAMIAMSLFEQAGLANSKRAHQRLHQSYLFSWSPGGEIGYGFKNWDYAIIDLKNPKTSAARSTQGIGYICSTGMKNIGEYSITWPDNNEKRTGLTNLNTSWVKTESATNIVYQRGGASRMVIRQMTRPEPKQPYPITGKPIGHYGRAGQGALAHHIGGASRKSWKYLGDHFANACASSPNDILRGHASTLMGTLWGSLGAARAEEKRFRAYMDGIKWWFIMAETHDGGFVVMPGHDYASTDHVYATRNLPSATAALILSVKNRRLRITGANSTGSAPATGINPIDEIQSDDFKIVHCLREAKYVSGKGSITSVLNSLALMARRDNDRGKEAVIFAERLRKWLVKHNASLLEKSKTHPAKVLMESEIYLRRVRGLEESKALTARMSKLQINRDIRILVAAYKKFDALVKYERTRGASRSTEASKKRLAATLESYVLKKDLDKAVLDEAKQLLSQVKK
ncbi:MAG: hypothetical protein HN350_05185 [Phycisphaerales bacterium]|nr:hypothetical protein [Phycisphaerales bacterium]